MTSRFLLGGALGVLSRLSAIGLLLVSAWLISRAAEQPPVLYLMVAIVGVRAFGIARAVLRYAERLLTHDAVLRRLAAERVALVEALFRSAPRGLPRSRRGDLMRRIVADVDALGDRIVRVRQPFVENCAAAAATVGVVLWLEPVAGLALGAAVLACLLGVPAVVTALGRRHDADLAPTHGRMSAEVVEAVDVAAESAVYGRGPDVAARLRSAADRLADAERRAAWTAGLGSALVAVAVGAAVCAAAVSGVAAVADGRLDRVALAVVVLAPLALWEGLDELPLLAQRRRRTGVCVRRLEALRALRPAVVDPAEPLPLPDRWDLRVRDLAVGWDGEAVASRIAFDVPEGGVLAVTGPSGGGKSTLAATLGRLIEPVAGTIELGGAEVRSLATPEVRSRIALVEQEGHAFDTTIRENLRIGDPAASDEAMLEALRRAGLGGFLAGLADGLDTPAGPRGGHLSGGERQRLALARALLARRRILVLDEPTEFCDRPTAERLIDDLLALRPGVSLVVATHSAWVLDRLAAHGPVLDLAARRGPLRSGGGR